MRIVVSNADDTQASVDLVGSCGPRASSRSPIESSGARRVPRLRSPIDTRMPSRLLSSLEPDGSPRIPREARPRAVRR